MPALLFRRLVLPLLLASWPAFSADEDLTVTHLSERNVDGRNQVCLRFSRPLDTGRDLQSYFSISRKQGGVAEGGWLFSSGDRLACFSNTQPATEYRVTVYRGLPAKGGARLAENFNKEITTRKLTPAVSFDTRGSVLLPGISPGLPVVSVNVPAVDVTFHRVLPQHREAVLNELESGYYYTLMRSLGDWTALAYTGRFDLGSEPNRRVHRTIATADIPALRQPGLYVAVMKPAGSYPDTPQVTHFSVTDLGLHARRYPGWLDVHIHSLTTAEPLAGVKVSLLDGKGQVLQQTRSSPDGEASFSPLPKGATLLVAEQGDNQSLLRLTGPALDLSAFDLGERPQQAQTLSLYSERDIYRPGETLHVNALLRDGDGRLDGAPPLQARLLQPDGQVVRRLLLKPGEQGYYQRDIPLPDNAPTGGWRLEVDKPDGKAASFPFKVEEFLPERMKLVFADGRAEPPVLAPADSLAVPVRGEYLYGAPASGNRLTASLRVSHWRSPIAALKDYQFGDVLDTGALGRRELQDLFLGADGKAVIRADSSWWKTRSPLKLTLTASLYESGGRPVTRRYDLLVWPGDPQVGIRPEFGADENPPENSRVRFDLVRATRDGKLLGGELAVTLIREERQHFWEYDEGQGWHYETSDEEYPVEMRDVSVAAGAPVSVELPVEWGRYRLEVVDAATGRKSSLRFFAGTDGRAEREASRQSSRPDVVGLALDKPAYRAGETARLTINPPHDGEALILVEADRPLWTGRRQVTRAGTVVEVPVAPEWRRHDIHVSVLVLRPASKVASITPTRAFGLIHLPLDREERRLSLTIDSVDKSEPDKPLAVTIKLANATPGKRYRVTVAAVDTGVLSLTDFTTPDPFDGFFGRRRYGVESRDLYGALIELNRYERATLRFGGDAPNRGGKAPAAEIQIVSLHSGPVVFDANGEARVSFDLPDFNGRLRLMAVAFGDERFGHAEREVTIAAPVVTQLAMPRFLAAGDRATLALDLHNQSGKPQTLRLKLDATAPLKIGEAEREVTLADGERSTLRFPVEAGFDLGAAKLTLTASGDGLTIHRDWSLALRPPWPRQTHREQLSIDAGESARFDLGPLGRLLPYSVEARLHLDDQVDLGAAEQWQALLQYPYGCLEQTGSRVWPWLHATGEVARALNLPADKLAERAKRIDDGLRRIEGMQLSNGGFGLWDNRSPEEHWLTAYIADLLLDAEAQGFPVQPQMKQAALKRLEDYLREPQLGFERYTDFGDAYRFAYRAYAGYVLSRVNRANLGQLHSLYDHEAEQARAGLPLVHLGLALLAEGDRRRGEQAVRAGLKRKRNPDDYLGDYGSVIRDDALMVHLLQGEPAFRKAVADRLMPLVSAVAERDYLSTQERNALFLAALALREQADGPWRARLHRGSEAAELDRNRPYDAQLGATELAGGLSIDNIGRQMLWVSLTLSGYPDQPPEPASKGYTIGRQFFDRDGKPLDIHHLKSGDLVLVHLAIDAPKRMQDTLVTDLLPAGLELENQNLEHSIRLDQFRIDGKTIPELQGDTAIIHQEYRDDRYVVAIDHGKYGGRSHLFYLARAVTPGRYRIPPPLVEDMYRPQYRAVGEAPGEMVVAP